MCQPCPRTCVHHVSGPYTYAEKIVMEQQEALAHANFQASSSDEAPVPASESLQDAPKLDLKV